MENNTVNVTDSPAPGGKYVADLETVEPAAGDLLHLTVVQDDAVFTIRALVKEITENNRRDPKKTPRYRMLLTDVDLTYTPPGDKSRLRKALHK